MQQEKKKAHNSYKCQRSDKILLGQMFEDRVPVRNIKTDK